MNRLWITLPLALLAINISTVSQARDRIDRDNPVADYIGDRGRDFADIFLAQALIPSRADSIGLKARVTTLFQAGAIRFFGKQAGMDRRHFGVQEVTRKEIGVSVLYSTYLQSKPVADDCPTGETEYDPEFLHYNGWDDGKNRPGSIEFVIQLFCLPGVDFGLYPCEALDFALGFTGLDIFGDDTPEKPRQAVKTTFPGEPLIEDPDDFTFEESYDRDLAPYTFETSPAAAEEEYLK